MADPKGTVFQVKVDEKTAIYNCFMNFTKEGGFFIPCTVLMEVGDFVCLIISIPDSAQQYYVSGKVAWIGNGRNKGFGVHFTKDSNSSLLKNALEKIIGSFGKSQNPTFTM